MELVVVARNRKERIALKYGETFLNMLGIKLEDLVDFRRIIIENESLIKYNTALLDENKTLKGQKNANQKDNQEDIIDYLSKK